MMQKCFELYYRCYLKCLVVENLKGKNVYTYFKQQKLSMGKCIHAHCCNICLCGRCFFFEKYYYQYETEVDIVLKMLQNIIKQGNECFQSLVSQQNIPRIALAHIAQSFNINYILPHTHCNVSECRKNSFAFVVHIFMFLVLETVVTLHNYYVSVFMLENS